MAIRDIFKRKKSEEKKVKPKDYNPPTTRGAFQEGSGGVGVSTKGGAPELKEVNIEKPVAIKTPKVKKEAKVGEAHRVLKTPQVTEKATGLVGQNQYVFKVWPRANKVETKKAIEDLYGVDVISVKIIKVPRKRRRLGRIQGFRRGYKKAIVRIKEGQKIEIMPK